MRIGFARSRDTPAARAIRPPAKFHPFTAILLWMTLVVFPVAYTWNGFMTTYGPFHFTWREYPTVHSNSEFLPLNLFLALQGQSTEPRRLTDYRSSRMIIATTSTRSQAGALTVDASAGTYEYANSKTTRVVRSGPLTSAAIREWLASHNYAPSADPRCAAAIDELATILIALQTRDAAILSKYPRNVVRGPLFRGARPLPPASNFAVQTGGPAIIPKYTAKAYAMLITLPVLVLAVGTFLILRRAKAKDRPYPARRDAHTIPRP